MKKNIIIILFLINSASFALEKDITFKIGVHVPVLPKTKAVDTTAFENTIGFNIGVHKMMALGLETGFSLTSKDSFPWSTRYTGSNNYNSKTSNIFTFPVLFTIRIHFDLRDKHRILPYILTSFGAGLLLYDHPDKEEFYYGYAWQMLGGISIRLNNYRKLELLTELGYCGNALQNEEKHEIESSGLLFRIGMRIIFAIDK